ncbi:MAG: glucose-1-phosphate thymidylyltransferase RfbA [Polyangiaceae bacterium]|nr:glucose-1-phosphate thymidylyltransferase RfbA [Polyangiaceae bacterium]
MGSRLFPITRVVSKQLLPIYDKPMIYYPLSVLMLAGLREVMIISTPRDLPLYSELFGDGAALGMSIAYAEQPRPGGLAQGLVIARDFLAGAPACLALGDNIFYGSKLVDVVRDAARTARGATIFACPVKAPERYGVVELGPGGAPLSIEEKPAQPRSGLAVPGLYFYGPEAAHMASDLRPSARGEVEITDLHRIFLARGELSVVPLGRGVTWLDAGSYEGLLHAAMFVEAVQTRQGLKVGCPEEIAFGAGWIDEAALLRAAAQLDPSEYAEYLRAVARQGVGR